MAVTLDAPAMSIQISQCTRRSYAPMWRVRCEDGGPYDRLYLLGADEQVAARRAEREFGWRRDGDKVFCRDHGHG